MGINAYDIANPPLRNVTQLSTIRDAFRLYKAHMICSSLDLHLTLTTMIQYLRSEFLCLEYEILIIVYVEFYNYSTIITSRISVNGDVKTISTANVCQLYNDTHSVIGCNYGSVSFVSSA